MNELDAFDQHLRGTLEQFEVPYNSADWAQLERALDGERRGWLFSGAGLATLLIAGAVAVGGATYLWSSAQEQQAAQQASATPANAATTSSAASEDSADRTAPAPTSTAAGDASPVTANTGATAPISGGMHAAGNETVSTSEAAATTPRPATATGAVTTPAKPTVSPAPQQHTQASGAPAPRAEATFHASISEGCPGTAVDFKVEHMPEDGIYLWNFGDGSFSNKPNPEHTFTKPGSYQVMLSMSATGVGTIHNKPSSDMIVIHEAPRAAFNALKQEYEGHIPSVHFENRAMGGKNYVWNFGDGATSQIAHPDHIYKKKGVYQVELTVTNELGCVDKAVREVRIDKDYNLDAPASFTPNGEGTSTMFMPEALRALGVKFHLAVYDLNGTLIYETTDATKPWSGRLNNRGELLPAGEYVWVVDVSENLHLAETYTGKVQLVR